MVKTSISKGLMRVVEPSKSQLLLCKENQWTHWDSGQGALVGDEREVLEVQFLWLSLR